MLNLEILEQCNRFTGATIFTGNHQVSRLGVERRGERNMPRMHVMPGTAGAVAVQDKLLG